MSAQRLIATVSSRLRAHLGAPRPLHYAAHAPQHDLPSHVRAGSAVRRWNGRLVVVQDDVHALAAIEEESGLAHPILLPRGADGRRSFGEAIGNKSLKMDLEAAVVLSDGRLVVFGSGSTDRRQRLVVLDADGSVSLVDASPLYGHLRTRVDFSGAELNVEGAVVAGRHLWLFQRGNGVSAGAVNAVGELSLEAFIAWLGGGPLPTLERVRQVDLGSIAGVRFGFTDAVALPDGRVAFLAGAENSADTYRDGEVLGCRFGLIDGDVVQVCEVVDSDGRPTLLKLEGLDRCAAHDGFDRFVVIADQDDPDTPALLATLEVAEVR
jgi:hypothetical protein